MSQDLDCPGIDKIDIYARSYTIRDTSIFGIESKKQPGQSIYDLPKIITDKSGKCEHGIKALYFGKKLPFIIDVKPTKDKLDTRLKLSFNPSKILHPYNLIQDTNEIKSVVSEIKKELKDVGIMFDVEGENISRLDPAKQPIMDRSLSTYRPVYDFMEGSRMKQRGYESGYLFISSEHQICFYSKSEELKNQTLDRMLRGEVRFLSSRSVRENTGISCLNDLYKTDCYEWNEFYKKHLNNRIFKYHLPEGLDESKILDFDSEVKRLQRFMFNSDGKQKRGAILKWLVALHFDLILVGIYSTDFFFQIMKEAGFTSRHINNIKRDFSDMMQTSINKGNLLSVSVLINELKEKFAA